MEVKSYKKNVVRDVALGVRYEVTPFKKVKDIEKIKQYLIGSKNKRNYCIFVVGINVGLRCEDLLSLKIGDVATGKDEIKDKILIIEQKTGKVREFELNSSAKEAIKLYLNTAEFNQEDWLFPSRKGNEYLSVDSLRKIIKDICKELGIKGNYGGYSLRKTFGYHCYINNIQQNPLILPTLQKMFNHSSPTITLRYIGITSDEISNVYQTLNL